jgi:hypothetical protein
MNLADAFATTTDDHSAMHARPARTANDEGFEDIAGWFATPGQSRPLTRPRRAAYPRQREKTT